MTLTDGSTRGATTCTDAAGDSHLSQVVGIGGTWTVTRTARIGVPMAVADDGTATYTLYRTYDRLKLNNQHTIRLRKVARSGAVTDVLLDNDFGAFYTITDSGSVVARNGQWWAVWGTYASDARARVFSAGTLGFVQPAHDTGLQSRAPVIALNGDTVLMALDSGSASQNPIALSRAPIATGVWSVPTPIPGAIGFFPALQRDGSTIRVAYYRTPDFVRSQAFVAQRINGTWTSHQLSGGNENLARVIRAPLFVGAGTDTVLGWTTGTRVNGVGPVETHVQLAQPTSAGGWRERSLTIDTFTSLTALGLRTNRLLVTAAVIPTEAGAPLHGVYTRSQ